MSNEYIEYIKRQYYTTYTLFTFNFLRNYQGWFNYYILRYILLDIQDVLSYAFMKPRKRAQRTRCCKTKNILNYESRRSRYSAYLAG